MRLLLVHFADRASRGSGLFGHRCSTKGSGAVVVDTMQARVCWERGRVCDAGTCGEPRVAALTALLRMWSVTVNGSRKRAQLVLTKKYAPICALQKSFII